MGFARHKNKSGSSSLRKTGVVFVIIGIVVIGVIVYLMYDESRYDSKYDRVESHIVDIDSHMETRGERAGEIRHTVIVAYEYNGVYYDVVDLKSFSSSMYKGQMIPIYLEPSAPTDPKLKTGIGFLLAYMVIGVFISFIGVCMFIIAGMSAYRKKRLVDKGQGELFYATVVSAGPTSLTVNNRRTYKIIATLDDEYGVTHTFNSEHLYFDPGKDINEGEHIKVYIDPKNYKKYYMCVEEIRTELS